MLCLADTVENTYIKVQEDRPLGVSGRPSAKLVASTAELLTAKQKL